MASQGSFRFGVELELLLHSRKKSHSSWKSLAKDVSKRLTKTGIPNHVNESGASGETYVEWSIVQEVTIPSQPGKNLWGIELVSPVYQLHDSWGAELQAIFVALTAGGYTPRRSPHCSTHIHISGAPTPLTPGELASMARSALIFEQALDALMPSTRQDSSSPYWCQSNRVNPALRGLPLSGAVAVIDQASSAAQASDSSMPIVEAMNLFPAASAYGHAHRKGRDFIRGKVYKWNLEGMLLGGRQTVEFRLPPGCLGAEDAREWVELAIVFVAGALAGGANAWDGNEDGTSVKELWEMLINGAAALGWEDVTGLEQIFAKRD